MVSLDSSFLIDLLAGVEAASAHASLVESTGELAFVTAPAAAEVLVGAYRAGPSYLRKAKILIDGLPLLPFDREAYDLAGRLGAELLHRGTPIGQADLFIGAITLRHGESLLTRDTAYSKIPGLRTQSY